MNLDDESLLTAYLDGELDADRRLAVESALLSSPSLSDRLRDLAAVRDLVSGLPRPASPRDLAPMVLARIGRRRGRSAILPTAGARLLAGSGIAATIGMALTLALTSNRGPAVAVRAPVPEPTPTVAVRAPTATVPRPVADPIGRPEAVKVAAGSPDRDDEAERAREREREQVREMLDNPNLTRVLVVADVIGGHAEDRVDALIHQTPRTDPAYGRITIGQGIIIDPKHPHRATVFALAMDRREIEGFRAKLREAFPDAVEEAGADPDVVTQLAEIGQMAVLPGTRAVELVPPDGLPSRLALRGPLDDPDHPVPDPLAEPGPAVSSQPPRAAIAAGSPPSREGDGHAAAEAADDRRLIRDDRDRERRRQSSVVLVWVAARES